MGGSPGPTSSRLTLTGRVVEDEAIAEAPGAVSEAPTVTQAANGVDAGGLVPASVGLTALDEDLADQAMSGHMVCPGAVDACNVGENGLEPDLENGVGDAMLAGARLQVGGLAHVGNEENAAIPGQNGDMPVLLVTDNGAAVDDGGGKGREKGTEVSDQHAVVEVVQDDDETLAVADNEGCY